METKLRTMEPFQTDDGMALLNEIEIMGTPGPPLTRVRASL